MQNMRLECVKHEIQNTQQSNVRSLTQQEY